MNVSIYLSIYLSILPVPSRSSLLPSSPPYYSQLFPSHSLLPLALITPRESGERYSFLSRPGQSPAAKRIFV